MPEEPFSVHPETMNQQANVLFDGIAQSKAEHTGHHDALEAALPGMLDASKAALEAAHAALVDQMQTLHHQLGQQGAGMQEFSGAAFGMDDQNRDSFK